MHIPPVTPLRPDDLGPDTGEPWPWWKRWVKRLLRRAGFDLVRYRPTGAQPVNILDLAVRAAVARDEAFFFVQIGANDGVRDDPIRHLVRELEQPGLLVEPLPDLFAALQRNYADQPQLRFENVAIASDNGHVELARFHPEAPIPDTLHGLASADIERTERFAEREGLSEHLQRVTVPSLSLEALAARHAVERIDLLVMDVEGAEWTLLQAVFRAGYEPGIVFLEFVHLAPEERLQTEHFLAQHGYAIAYTGIDLIAVRGQVP